MRYLLTIIAIVCLSGCFGRTERAQAAADLDSGLVAAIQAAADAGAQEAVAILTGARKYVGPSAGVPHAEFPAPTMQPLEIRKDPVKYGEIAPPEPKGWGVWGMVAGAGGVALLAFRALAPLIPGAGPLVKVAADAAWAVMATREQKKADQAKDQVSQAVALAVPVLEALHSIPPEALPGSLAKHLNDPRIAEALARLKDHAAAAPKPGVGA